MLRFFRVLSIMEGLSFLTILSVSIGLISRDFIYPIGMLHGILFLLYVLVSLIVCHVQKWALTVWLPLLMAGLIPFGFVFVELYLRKLQSAEETD